MASRPPENEEIAEALEDVAALLEAQNASPYRVRAYREGARVVRTLDRPAATLLAEGGTKALDALPGIGRSLAAAIAEIAATGRLRLRDRLVGATAPEDLFTVVPGIGKALAHRLHETLHVDSLEELEAAAHDGRLESVPGVGPRRARALRDSLASLLARSRRRAPPPDHPLPPVAALLDLDARYRREAAAGSLPRIAPRRFNPEHRAWLPVLHADVDGWHATALFSNTALAHKLGRTDDWVVVLLERDGAEAQCTLVTETHGPLARRRVVRGRERETPPAPPTDPATTG
ncbi:MAG: DNA-binding protein [Planctomycetes bacterium]|nr:DNA-binding protein [Planctomycetota bacterium]